ncbi:DNA-binding protein [Serratia plymuthica]|jgi:putative transcriptional regulator|uniref:helix-turn-helix domain-containing protein n=1 Tax=Serratia plymuthica TaxID=82996 RepID=UPI0007A0DB7B|nr:DNA-binding transcriptional regulator [Serratia plymuthica]KYQ96420.1 DNA-binding protein [Serratia plymuthica]NIC27279.1 DNA-binding transcriptional regulator [Serratia plymuthica]QPS87908.1 DNA-binding transcriptional regulator [Serratia plymuthica]
MSKILAEIHQEVQGLHKSGFVDDVTMRTFDMLCLHPVKDYTPADIRALRERENVSQPVFALHLNVSKKAVQKWERGEARPNSAAMKLLSLVDRNGLSILA